MSTLSGILLLAGPAPSMLRPHGPLASEILSLWWIFFVVLAAIYLVVVGLTMLAVRFASIAKIESALPEAPVVTGLEMSDAEREREQRMKRTIAGAMIVSEAILVILTISSFFVGNAISTAPKNDPIYVDVIGHQWWWEFRYIDTLAQNQITVSNELHIPTGKPVILHLTSHDVIHSFWAANLNGKRDAIPGYKTTLTIQTDHDGVYRGACAEFCGHEHAKMGLLVISEPLQKFLAWREASKQNAVEPIDAVAKRGKEVFLSAPCSNCHTIQGTSAGGKLGPALTHIGSNQTFAAATFPLNIGHLTGWLLDPQSMKPGVRMPQNMLQPQDARAVAAYLMSLK